MKLENTYKDINIKNLVEDSENMNTYELNYFYSLVNEMSIRGYNPTICLILSKSSNENYLLTSWLKDNPEACDWLIKYGYAKEKEFKPVLIRIDTKEESQILLNFIESQSPSHFDNAFKNLSKALKE